MANPQRNRVKTGKRCTNPDIHMFLTGEDLATLTGRKRATHQIAALKAMGIPFWINAAGKPIVTRAAVEGRGLANATEKPESWQPNALKRAA